MEKDLVAVDPRVTADAAKENRAASTTRGLRPGDNGLMAKLPGPWNPPGVHATALPVRKLFVFGALMNGGAGLSGGRHAELKDYTIRFVAPGIPLIEPSFAAIVPSAGMVAHGVLFEVDEPTLTKLSLQEDDYQLRAITVELLGREEECCTFFIPSEKMLAKETSPSARYLRLLRRGMQMHGLPEACVDELSKWERGASRLSLLFAALKPLVIRMIPFVGLKGAIGLLVLLLVACATTVGWVLVVLFAQLYA
jgi:gamma-glutamylcyclotransferase (GGCT)/AIG2-like uncharacterized protein YtfP